MLQADVKLPAIFGDHMVLQQEAALPVWGTADPGEKVTVTVGAESATATTDASGRWLVKLKALPSGSAPVTMAVEGKNKLTFSDVLVGDVWVCSGQSNMEYQLLAAHNASTELPKASDPQLRLFHVTRKTSLQPETDVTGSWQVCTTDTAKTFSAVGFFFGRELRTALNRPIGLIESAWSGTEAQAWTSISALQKEPSLKAYVDKYNMNLANYPKALADAPARNVAYKAAVDAWHRDVNPSWQAAIKDWNEAVTRAKAAGQPEPPKPQPSKPIPPAPDDPTGGPHGPSNLFNGMIAPVIPYAIKGVTWYQGESNANQAMEYRTLFPLMITDWRQRWGLGDFPFLFVQLACFSPGQNWALLRESQLKTLALPDTGMASAVDIGDPTFIHPQDKLDVGLRLALAARHIAYGQNTVFSGPIYDSMKVEGGAIRISFTQAGGGLVVGHAPWIPVSVQKNPVSTTELESFTIAGADKKWVPAQARIDGNSVVVSSADVTQPVAVRYGWANAPRCNLYNKEMLPASPFRTDDWPELPPAASATTTAAPATPASTSPVHSPSTTGNQ